MENNGESKKRQYPMRLDESLIKRFKEIRPESGSLPKFVEQCMTEFIILWGDRQTPTQVAKEATNRVFDRAG